MARDGSCPVNLARVGLLIVAIAAGIAAAYAAFQAFDARTAPPIVIEDAAGVRPVVVEVRGAVNAPGVYELPAGARLQDASLAADGLGPHADLSTVNLARRLRDEEMVVVVEVPRDRGTPAASITEVPVAETAIDLPLRLNLNRATASELDELPGIGAVLSERIVRFRDANGPFRSVDDLIHVDGISGRLIDQIRDLVTVGP